MKSAVEILRTLIEEVENPDIPNGPAAQRAVLDAKELFKHAVSERGPAPEVRRIGRPRKDETRGVRGVERGHRGKAAGESGPDGPEAA